MAGLLSKASNMERNSSLPKAAAQENTALSHNFHHFAHSPYVIVMPVSCDDKTDGIRRVQTEVTEIIQGRRVASGVEARIDNDPIAIAYVNNYALPVTWTNETNLNFVRFGKRIGGVYSSSACMTFRAHSTPSTLSRLVSDGRSLKTICEMRLFVPLAARFVANHPSGKLRPAVRD